MPEGTCSIPGCAGAVRCRDWCVKHYARWHRLGDPLAPVRVQFDPIRGRSLSLRERILEKIDTRDGHWLWTGATLSNGYGVITIDKRTMKAHRVSYELFIGPIADGLHIDHLCRVRNCVRPDHLEPVTPQENTRRSPVANGARTHCPQGHPYDGENTNANAGRRICRTCSRERARRWREAKASK